MRLLPLTDEGDVRRECQISGSLLPNKLKRILGRPHVLAAAGDGVSFLRRVESGRAGMQYHAEILVGLEDADGRLRRERWREQNAGEETCRGESMCDFHFAPLVAGGPRLPSPI